MIASFAQPGQWKGQVAARGGRALTVARLTGVGPVSPITPLWEEKSHVRVGACTDGGVGGSH